MAVSATRSISVMTPWVIAAAVLLGAGALSAQTVTADPAEGATCPHAAEGSCPHGHGGMSMHGSSGDGAGPMAIFERIGEEMALTEPQKQQLAALMEMYRPRMKELADRGQESTRAIMDMAPDDPRYNTQADELSKQAGASAAEMVALMTELQANAYALLTSEQQSKFMSMRVEQRQRMEQRKAEMEAQRAAGEPVYGHGFGGGHGAGKHQCKACAWLDADGQAQEEGEMEALENQEIGF